MRKIWLFAPVGTIFCFLLLLGCDTTESNPVQILSESVEIKCNTMFDDGCREIYEIAKQNPVEISKNGKTISVSSENNCCAKFKVTSAEEKNGKITINLVEAGEDVCDCGMELQIITLQLDRAVDPNNLEIYQHNEFSKKAKMVYP